VSPIYEVQRVIKTLFPWFSSWLFPWKLGKS